MNPGGFEDDLEFEDISGLKKHKSDVWKNFLLNRIYSVAKCTKCLKVFKVTKGTTSSLKRHLVKCSINVSQMKDETAEFDSE